MRSTAMSMAPKGIWSSRPPRSSRASKIIPAQVPQTGMPSLMHRANGWRRLLASSIMEIVVDSPPGIIRQSTCCKSLGWRTCLDSTPEAISISWCRRTSPCSPRTPAVKCLPCGEFGRLPAVWPFGRWLSATILCRLNGFPRLRFRLPASGRPDCGSPSARCAGP